MAAYIRLPRDSSETEHFPSPPSSTHTSTHTPTPHRKHCLRLNHSHLRLLGTPLSLIATGITAGFLDTATGPYQGAAVPLLLASILSTLLNGLIGLWVVFNWALNKYSRCENCKHKAATYPAGPWIALIILDGFIAFMAFVCSVVQLVEADGLSRRRRGGLVDLSKAAAAFGLMLFFLHAWFVVCDLSQKVRIEVRFVDGQEENGDGALRRDEMVEEEGFGRDASGDAAAPSLKASEHAGSNA